MEQDVSSFYLELKEQLEEIPDPRRIKGRRYKLVPLLLLLILGFLRGRKNVKDVLESYAEDRDMLDFLGLKRVPAPGVYTNLFHKLDLESVNRALANAGLSLLWRPRHIAVDGKTTKGSLRDGLYLHVVNAATAQGIPLSQVVSEPAGGEIAAARRALEGLPLSGAVVTGDAMFAQRDLCRGISEKGGPGSSS